MNQTLRNCLVVLCSALTCFQTTLAAPVAKARVKVVTINGKPPHFEDGFVFAAGTTPAIQFKGSEWSEWAQLPLPDTEVAVVRATVNLHKLTDSGVPLLALSVESMIEGSPETSTSAAELFGPALGFIRWKDKAGDKALVDTFGGHDRRVYGEALKAAAIPVDQRPKKILFGERFIGGDQDLLDWRDGLNGLAGMGFNAIYPVPAPLTAEAQQLGFRSVWGAVYNPPGYVFNFADDRQEQYVKFVQEQLGPVFASGWKKEQIGFWFTSDEPGWYYPDTYNQLNTNKNAIAAFKLYLRGRNLNPEDVGKKTWDDEIQFIGRKQYDDLQSRRLYYWSNRFLPYASSVFFGEVTKVFEAQIRAGVPVVVNFNNFFGTCYTPGPVGNNSAKTDPNAAMGQPDWLEFGRCRGATAISTEDWFADDAAERWSFYASRLRSAAELGGVQFGGLVIPRTAGQTPMGMSQKLLSLVGHGAKTIKFFTFGPEYNFAGNCYSENPAVFKPLSTALSIIGRAEALLYPGKARVPQVGIVTPQSAQLWDLEDQQIAKGLLDATNTKPFSERMQYMSEVWALFNALQHSAVPVGFIDQDGLADRATIQKYRVIYLTTPNLPAESAEGLLTWVANGGTLISVAGSAMFDRYHQPLQKLIGASGIAVAKPLRPLADEKPGTPTPIVTSAGNIPAFGPIEELTLSSAKATAQLENGSPAITDRTLGNGRLIRYAMFPGTSYVHSKNDIWRQLMIQPLRSAGVTSPVVVNLPKVEAPVLYSDAGAAVTLLNWSGKSETVEVGVLLDKPVKEVESVLKGKLKFGSGGGRVVTRVPLDEADVILFRY